ncbi:MAG: SMR family transporter, partial [Bacillota bacterium]|nr:SMR family transporter [Bacillota bacterium]
ILAILSSSSIAIGFKISSNYNLNKYSVAMANYFMAFIISIYLLLKDYNIIIMKSSLSEFFKISVLGILTGVLFFLSFILYQMAIKKHGASITSMFVKLGILIPMIISIVLWKEYPTTIQSFAILASIGSIIIVNLNFKKEKLIHLKIILISLFFIGGMAEFANKIFQKYFLIHNKSLFLFFVFISALLLNILLVLKRKIKINKKELIGGSLIGIFNLSSSFFLIESLMYLKTSIAFALFSSISMSIIIIVSTLFFEERLKEKDLIAVIITFISLIIINSSL